MQALFNKRSDKVGLPPGSAVYVGRRKAEEVNIVVFDYDENDFEITGAVNASECFRFRESATVTWINVEGLHEAGTVEELGTHFGVHPLVIEDILNPDQRPKVETFDDNIFIVMKMVVYDEQAKGIVVEQVSLIVGENFLISFQEKPGDCFNPVRQRIKNGVGRIRKSGPDYLAYALMDAVVDNYFTVLEGIGEDVEELEQALISRPTTSILHTIHTLKREMIFLRRSVWPLRDVLSSLQREETHLVKESTKIYIRDVYDHTVQIIDIIETVRDVISGMLDVYLSSVSNKMNEVMKVLTIFASIFIPLTFIAGVYGMNFEYMPELKWHWGYFCALGFMAAVGLAMLVMFRVKKWF